MQRKYYEAYDDRYCQIHELNLQWFDNTSSPIVAETIAAYGITKHQKILEIGCGEGRDAFPLLEQGFDLLATDVSQEAIRFCKNKFPNYAEHFQVLDCITDQSKHCYDFIYAVAVVHMLVDNDDRRNFYRFIRHHLNPGGLALICTMGNGIAEHQSDIRNAFDLQERIHQQSETPVKIASTSCRMVSFPTFRQELANCGLTIVHEGMTAIEPDFSQMMYAIVK